jgi:hypothetical protein
MLYSTPITLTEPAIMSNFESEFTDVKQNFAEVLALVRIARRQVTNKPVNFAAMAATVLEELDETVRVVNGRLEKLHRLFRAKASQVAAAAALTTPMVSIRIREYIINRNIDFMFHVFKFTFFQLNEMFHWH